MVGGCSDSHKYIVDLARRSLSLGNIVVVVATVAKIAFFAGGTVVVQVAVKKGQAVAGIVSNAPTLDIGLLAAERMPLEAGVSDIGFAAEGLAWERTDSHMDTDSGKVAVIHWAANLDRLGYVALQCQQGGLQSEGRECNHHSVVVRCSLLSHQCDDHMGLWLVGP